MTKSKAVKWLSKIIGVIGSSDDASLWVYGEVLEDIKEMIEAQPEMKWTPCSERLPKKSGEHIVTIRSEEDGKKRVAPRTYIPRVGFLTFSNETTIAWMSLPKVYNGEE